MKQSLRKHGLSGTKTYTAWAAMKRRCLTETNPAFKYYGGRGITVCDGFCDFANFHKIMGECPDELSLDRKNTNGSYTCGECGECLANGHINNCRWANRQTQNNNTRRNRVAEFNGVSKTIADWAREYGLSYRLVSHRVGSLGWPIEQALTTRSGEKLIQPETMSSDTYKLQQRARQALYRAVKSGKVIKPPHCQEVGCGEAVIQAHHHNGYDKDRQLDVVWVCVEHHPQTRETILELDGVKKTQREWSVSTGIKITTIRSRLLAGWSIEKTLTTPVAMNERLVTRGDITKNMAQWSKDTGLSIGEVTTRANNGSPITPTGEVSTSA